MDPVVKEMGDRCAADWPPESAKKYDQMNWEEFLQSRGASRGAVDAMMPWQEPEERRGGGLYDHNMFNRGGLGVKSPADLLGESGVGLPDEAAAGTVGAEWAADSDDVPSVQY